MSSEKQRIESATTFPRGFSAKTGWKWPLVPARTLVTLNYGRALKADVRRPGSVPVFGTNGQCGWHDIPLTKGPGLILGRKGQGPLGVEWCDDDFWVIDTAYFASTLRPDVDLRYVYHVTKYVGLNHLKDGTSNPSLSREVFGSQLFPLPNLAEQERIVRVLTLFDDRITLLRETNTTLEAIAQALFKSWFVDFEPVHAKQQGRAPEGMDEATAALFPDGFEESELGVVPRGWSAGSFSDVARLRRGSINPLSKPDILFEHYSLPAFDSGQMPIIESGSEIKSNKTQVPASAVLLSKLNPHIPRVWMPTSAGTTAICSTEFLVFEPKGGASKEFLYCAFSTPQFQQLLCQLVTGTSNSHQRVKPDGVLAMPAIVPLPSVLESFEAVARPILERVGHNRQKAKTLATLRDTLLPRLISGQLRLPEAELAVDAAL